MHRPMPAMAGVSLILLAPLGASCGARAEAPGTVASLVDVTGAFVSAPPAGETAALYLTLINRGDQPDTLLHVITPEAAGVSYHAYEADGDMRRMVTLPGLAVAARDSLALVPGGLHIMLTSMRRAPGDSVHLSLAFRRAGTVVVVAPVLAPGELPPSDQH